MSEKRVVPLAPEDTLAGYDRWAGSYDAMANPMVAATELVLDRAPLGCAGQDVVEFGCGTGRNVARVLREGARSYLGVDGSPGMLARARAEIADPRATFVEGDVHGAIDLGARFDLALIVLVLEHVRDLAPLFASVRRALRDGGRLRIVEIHPDLVADGTVAHFEDGGAELRFTSTAHALDALAAELTRAGLALETMRAWSADELAAVSKLAKHRGRAVVLDVTAR
jgi:malonyl-CoA O-methyltransferase